MPSSAPPEIGTPITGSVVSAATAPGRAAASPAPAMTTAIPRVASSPTYPARVRGDRWADTDTCS